MQLTESRSAELKTRGVLPGAIGAGLAVDEARVVLDAEVVRAASVWVAVDAVRRAAHAVHCAAVARLVVGRGAGAVWVVALRPDVRGKDGQLEVV
jgi:hypothetical protein